MDRFALHQSSQQHPSTTRNSVLTGDQIIYTTSDPQMAVTNNFPSLAHSFGNIQFAERQTSPSRNIANSTSTVFLTAKSLENSPAHLYGADSEFDDDTDAKLREARKKGRPPKLENHTVDGFMCNICSKTFNNSSSLSKHRVTHSEERKFVCSECPKTFKRQDHLTGHMLTHSPVKPFVCDKCHKSYCDARSLKRHQDQCHSFDSADHQPVPDCQFARIDSQQKIDAEFDESVLENVSSSNADSLQIHFCRVCSRSFKTSQALNGHMRLHGGSLIKKDEDLSMPRTLASYETSHSIPSSLTAAGFQEHPLFFSNISQNVITNFVKKGQDHSSVIKQLADKQLNKDNSAYQFADSSSVGAEAKVSSSQQISQAVFNASLPLGSSNLSTYIPLSTCSNTSSKTGDAGVVILDNSCSSQLQALVLQHQLQLLNQNSQKVQPLNLYQLSSYNQQLQKSDSFGSMNYDSSKGDPRSSDPLLKVPQYSLLHSLLLPNKTQTQLVSQSSQLQQQDCDVVHKSSLASDCTTSVHSSTSAYQIDNSTDNENKFLQSAPELLGSYSDEMNFEGLNLEADGIDKMFECASSSIANECSLKESLSKDAGLATLDREDVGMENSIPEDLRNISTDALQMFSLTTSAPPPLLDQLGNEVADDDIRSNIDLLNTQGFLVEKRILVDYEAESGAERDEHIGAGGVDVAEEVTCSETGGICATDETSWTESSLESIMKKIIDLNEEDSKVKFTDPAGALDNDDQTPEGSFMVKQVSDEKIGKESEEMQEVVTGATNINLMSPSATGEKTEKFRNPSLLKMKRRHWPGPLLIVPSSSISSCTATQSSYGSHVGNSSSGSSAFAFQSRLRSPRVIPGSGSFDSTIPPPFNLPFVPYTPPPMLSPVRSGSGLFCLIQAALATQTPPVSKSKKVNSPELFEGLVEEVVAEESIDEEPPASDVKPHINEGPEYQAEIPDLEADPRSVFQVADHADMLWSPSVMQNISENEVRVLMDFSSCAAVPFNGCNKELAHHVLFLYGGDIKKSCLTLMEKRPLLPQNYFLASYKYSENSTWVSAEIDKFHQALMKYNKDFFLVSREIGTKTCKECIEFYYLWKKVCAEENRKLKTMRRRQDTMYNNLRSKAPQSDDVPNDYDDSCQTSYLGLDASDKQTFSTSTEIQSFPFPLSTDNISGRQSFHPLVVPAPQGRPPKKPGRHPKAGGRAAKPRSKISSHISPTVHSSDVTLFPCKECHRVFTKVKSRSAHMKSHRMKTAFKKLPGHFTPIHKPPLSSLFNPSQKAAGPHHGEQSASSPRGVGRNDYQM